MSNSIAFVQFSKAPVVVHGREHLAKTRLSPWLSRVQRARLHNQLLGKNARLIAECARGFANTSRAFLFLDLGRKTEVIDQELWKGRLGFSCHTLPLELCLQSGLDLGERLQKALHRVFASGPFETAVLIGSDCVRLTVHHLNSLAVSCLDSSSGLGFIPVEDGGYIALAVRKERLQSYENALFSGISWGGDEVLEQSLGALARIGVEPFLAPPLTDIDEYADLEDLPPLYYFSS